MESVGCVLLGAGHSNRMGRPKLLIRVRGRTIFEISLGNHLASSLARVCVVIAGWLGELEAMAAAYSGPRVKFIALKEPGEMSYSLKTGWKWLQDDCAPDAIMVSLADQPLVKPHTIDLLIASYRTGGKPICVPTYQGKWGHPVVIDSRLTEEIMGLTGDQGARPILSDRPGDILEVCVNTDEVILDLDREEDLKTVLSRVEHEE
jgi:molybdenum cofactor cytidylyltransferase